MKILKYIAEIRKKLNLLEKVLRDSLQDDNRSFEDNILELIDCFNPERPFSDYEISILAEKLAGKERRQIASRFDRDLGSVTDAIQRIYDKLGINKEYELYDLALRQLHKLLQGRNRLQKGLV